MRADSQVCALWHAEMWLRGGGGCVVVEGLSHMTNRFTVPCVVCGRMVRFGAAPDWRVSIGTALRVNLHSRVNSLPATTSSSHHAADS